MFASLTIVSFIVALAWIQQIFLNHLIKADIEALSKARSDALKQHSDSKVN